jgi:hypothetical protein
MFHSDLRAPWSPRSPEPRSEQSVEVLSIKMEVFFFQKFIGQWGISRKPWLAGD